MKMPNSASMSTYTSMMRVNSENRPFAKDLCDLFSALLIQLPLSQHRSLFKTYPSTFTTDEAVDKLGHLEVSNLVYTPNPLDVSNPILTRTTTTFSMSKDMAKALAQHFIHARLMESVTDPQNHRNILRDKRGGNIWALTPKGKFMIQDFSHRARVSIKHMQEHLNRIQVEFPILQFERLYDDDQITYSRQTMVEAFRRMMECIPTDTILIDDIGGLSSVNFIEYRDTFYGYQSFEWISEHTSVVSSEEAESVATEFLQYGWMAQLIDKSDREAYKREDVLKFQLDRRTQYYMTEKGRLLLLQRTTHQNGFSSQTIKSPSSASIPTVDSPNFSSEQKLRSQGSTTVSSSSNNPTSTCSRSAANQQHLSLLQPKQTQLQSVLAKDQEAGESMKVNDASRRLQITTGVSIAEQRSLISRASVSKRRLIEYSHSLEESLTKEINSLTTDSVFQLHSNHGFGFSSSSSTNSSTVATSPQTSPSQLCSVDKSSNDKQYRQSVDICSDAVEQLQLHVKDTNALLRSSDAQPTHIDHHTSITFKSKAGQNTNSQNAKLQSILSDPLTRMYFRQFLRLCFCEENINFWVDYTTLLKKVQSAFVNSSSASSSSSSSSSSAVTTLSNILAADSNRLLSDPYLYESLLTHCYVIYNNYFCPETAPNELNIDHNLRYDIAQYVQSVFQKNDDVDKHKINSKNDGDDNSNSSSDEDTIKGIADAANVPFGSISVSTTQQQQILSSPPMSQSNSSSGNTFRRSRSCHRNRLSNSFQQGLLTLRETNNDTTLLHNHLFNIIRLYDQANEHICMMMAEDCVPRFMKAQSQSKV